MKGFSYRSTCASIGVVGPGGWKKNLKKGKGKKVYEKAKPVIRWINAVRDAKASENDPSSMWSETTGGPVKYVNNRYCFLLT